MMSFAAGESWRTTSIHALPMATAAQRASGGAVSLSRVRSHRDVRRTCSEPVLAPVWEPNEGEEGVDLVPQWLHSLPMSEGEPASALRVPARDGRLPTPWQALLSQLAQGGTAFTLSPLSQQELVAAAHDSLRQKDAVPLRLSAGALEDHYVLKRELMSAAHYEVVEGVKRDTHKNYSLKIVRWRNAARLSAAATAGARLDPMRAFYLISSFVDEVFSEPNQITLCMKWGSHEVDVSHQLSCIILNALKLLRELLPPNDQQSACVRLQRTDLQRVLLRTMALDAFLEHHMYIE